VLAVTALLESASRMPPAATWRLRNIKVVGLFKNAQKVVNVPARGIIFTEGDHGDEMFGIIEGGVDLSANGHVLVSLGPDDVFGEMAIIDKVPRMATAVATEATSLAVIDRDRFIFLVQETPMFALSVMSSLASRLRHEA
jgi:CRP/FNR family cyclic AMP-dependent transcriptional regulator